jgi:cell division protein FtsZ
MSDADVKLDVGRELTRGLGAGANPEAGNRAAEDHPEESGRCLHLADIGCTVDTGARRGPPKVPG